MQSRPQVIRKQTSDSISSDTRRVNTQPKESPAGRTGSSEARYPKVSISLSKSKQQMILSDDRGNRIITHVNLVKHVLGVEYTKTEKRPT